MINKYICLLCKKNRGESYVGTRRGLRNHLKKEHHIKTEIKNKTDSKGNLSQQFWWKQENLV